MNRYKLQGICLPQLVLLCTASMLLFCADSVKGQPKHNAPNFIPDTRILDALLHPENQMPAVKVRIKLLQCDMPFIQDKPRVQMDTRLL